jgi:hypothetical protein
MRCAVGVIKGLLLKELPTRSLRRFRVSVEFVAMAGDARGKSVASVDRLKIGGGRSQDSAGSSPVFSAEPHSEVTGREIVLHEGRVEVEELEDEVVEFDLGDEEA